MTQKLVLYVHPSNELYGADRSLLRLVAGISGERYRPSVVVANDLPYSASLTTELSRLGIEHFRDDLGVLRRKYRSPVGAVNFFCRTMSSVIRLALWCRNHGVAIVHSNSMAVLAGGLSARLTGVPHIWHIREIITEPPWLNCFMGRAMYHLSDRAIAVSRAAQDSLLAVEPRLSDHLSVIYNGIDPSPYDAVNKETVAELRRSWHVTDGDVVVGMVGRVSAWKGQGSLLAAAALVLRKQPNTRLVMVGGTVPGEEWRHEQLLESAQQLGIAPRIHVEGFRRDIPAVMNALDVAVLPSERPDPFPTVVLEAMASRKPVVATAHGGALEQVDHGVTGLLVTPNDPQKMASALCALIADRKRAVEMGEAGHERLHRLFTVDQHLRAIESLYDELLYQRENRKLL